MAKVDWSDFFAKIKRKKEPYVPWLTVQKVILEHEIGTDAVIHVGAHLVQEAPVYEQHNFRKVIWVEALPQVANAARRILKDFSKHELIQAVCWSEPDVEIPFNISRGLFSSSALAMKSHKLIWPGSKILETVILKSTTLDKIAVNEQEISLLNIDVQGAELEVLKGGFNTLKKTDFIFLEVALVKLYEDQPLFAEIHNLLCEVGFGLLEFEINPETGDGSAFYANPQRTKEIHFDLELNQLPREFKIDKLEVASRWINYLGFRAKLGVRNIWRKFSGKEKVPF